MGRELGVLYWRLSLRSGRHRAPDTANSTRGTEQPPIQPPNNMVQQQGRLEGHDTSESRTAGPVCGNGWFGGPLSRRRV